VTNSRSANPSSGAAGQRRETDYEALILAAQTGNRQAMELLLMRAQEVAYRFSLLVCGHAEDADDAMQEALLKTYRFAGQIKEPAAFRTWLYRTVKNACLIGRRKRVHEPAHMVSLDELMVAPDGSVQHMDVEDGRAKPDEILANTRLRRTLRRALQQLPPDFREIVFLREIEGLSTREVADVVGISEPNVKTRLHRARLFLRQRLEAP
jgi:RNA polymerase sigma-70 factor (ECF subfamily)